MFLASLRADAAAWTIQRRSARKVETVGVYAIATSVKARIDTGAGVTSLNAQIIDVPKSISPGRPAKVKFQIKDDAGNTRVLETGEFVIDASQELISHVSRCN